MFSFALIQHHFEIEVAQPAVNLILAFTHGVVLRQQLATAVQQAQYLKGEIGFPAAQATGFELLVECFELGFGQLVFLGLVAQAGEAQLPEETLAATSGARQALFELLYGGFEAVLAQ